MNKNDLVASVAATAKMILAQPKHELDGENDFRLIMYAIAIPEDQWIEFEIN